MSVICRCVDIFSHHIAPVPECNSYRTSGSIFQGHGIPGFVSPHFDGVNFRTAVEDHWGNCSSHRFRCSCTDAWKLHGGTCCWRHCNTNKKSVSYLFISNGKNADLSFSMNATGIIVLGSYHSPPLSLF